MKTTKHIHLFATVLIALMWAAPALACTSAIVAGRLTANGRPLMWKHRDTNDMNNRIERIPATATTYEFVALFDSRDTRDTAAWTGMNSQGFAIMNTASYNLNSDNVTDMDKEGVLMRLALERCATVDEFEQLLRTLPRPMGVEANFGVIDAQGNGAYFETGNYKYVKYDLADEPSGLLVRTNYSYSGRTDEGSGYIRHQNAIEQLRPHVACCDITPAVFTEELSRTFYHSMLGRDDTRSGADWLIDQDYIPRRISSATIVIEGVLPGEDPSLTTMWTALGYPPCAIVVPVWTGEGGVPQQLRGQAPDRHAAQCDSALALKAQVFDIERGSGKHYIHLSRLYNNDGTGITQQLRARNAQAYRDGYNALARRRATLQSKK